MFQPDLLDVSGIGHVGPAFDQPVEVVFLEMKFPHQILDGDVGVVLLDVPGHFFEQDPVHGFALLPGQGKFIFGAHDPEDAQQQAFADVPGAYVVLVEFFQKHQGGLEEGDDLLGGDIFILLRIGMNAGSEMVPGKGTGLHGWRNRQSDPSKGRRSSRR